MFREIVSCLVNDNVQELDDYAWMKEVHVYLHSVNNNHNAHSYVHSLSQASIEPQIVIMSQQYFYGWTFYEQPEVFFSNNKISFNGNSFIGDQNTGKQSLCRYYAQLTAH